MKHMKALKELLETAKNKRDSDELVVGLCSSGRKKKQTEKNKCVKI